jgi:hypothetical protein
MFGTEILVINFADGKGQTCNNSVMIGTQVI